MGRQVFTAGEILTAANMNDLGDATVMVFDDASARTTAIPTPVEGMVTYLKDDDSLQVFDGSAFGPVAAGFTASTTITASNASFPVPALGSPIVKVTVIGGGGGGAASIGSTSSAGNGGVTTFNAGGAGTVTAAAGLGGRGAVEVVGFSGKAGFVSNNGGESGQRNRTGGEGMQNGNGTGGAITVAYLNLAGISTVDVNIGAGGAGGTGGLSADSNGGAGGRGEVILEFVAA